ncbi:chromosome segregation protein ScpA [Pedobacter sp. Leaf41]|jgi:segregation and condensation protein A|uniref:segregation and condensation protein A n=1 Tax=Pedobacter sp. Leaf41 TaxID=1736218 RepID=UPI000702E758|nr:segregation/condensation protein A [Pedobacter sp. Leaf41]KQN34064.1 chromosome segregation protein ScpA [Pedobacter sp. Leaf41]RZL46793.1 MAG: chromosome segregation protein ScpA [Pedobacter sp.]
MQAENFEIKLPVFEGPFDLLLFFIERDELNIQDIEIAKITNDFLAYIHQLLALNVEVASEFILVAATLMRIKSKMLLPRIEIDEAGNEINPEQDLIARLIAYKQFKSAAEEMKVLEDSRMKQERRGNIEYDLSLAAESSSHQDELLSLDLYKLLTVYHKTMQKYELRSEEVKHTVIQYPYTIEQQKYFIANLLDINKQIDFAVVLKNSENKVHFVYNFLAILEMLQQQLVEITIGSGFNNFKVKSSA